jgi:hypothetical protein
MRCVPAPDFSVAKAILWKGAVFDDPPYQRETGVWPLEKRQLFIDSLLNGFDVPKFYLHDLRGRHPTKVYAVVDGKQRLNAIWQFLADGFPLADDFRLEPANAPELPSGVPPPGAGARFSEFHPRWQAILRSTHLAVVLIRNATEVDIEELFARLNSGEPLNAAERRNARGGDIATLVRVVARRPFFEEWLASPGTRFHHFDLAARLLRIEHGGASGGGPPPDLRRPALDAFVEANRRLPRIAQRELIGRVDAGLGHLERIFRPADPLLARDAAVPLDYLFAGSVVRDDPEAVAGLRDFLEQFEMRRHSEPWRPVDGWEAALVEFSHLAQHAPYSPRSLARRLTILTEALGAERRMAQ